MALDSRRTMRQPEKKTKKPLSFAAVVIITFVSAGPAFLCLVDGAREHALNFKQGRMGDASAHVPFHQ